MIDMENMITTEQLKRKLEQGANVYILDVRDPEKYQAGSLEYNGVKVENIPYVTMIAHEQSANYDLARIPIGAEIVTVCTTGNKAQKAAELLREKGYSTVSLQGGLTAWIEEESYKE